MTGPAGPAVDERVAPASSAIRQELLKLRAKAGISTFKVRDHAPLLQTLRATDDQLLHARLDPSDRHLAAYGMTRCTINVRIMNTRQHVCLIQTLNFDETGAASLTDRRSNLQELVFNGMSTNAYEKLEADAYDQLSGELVMLRESPCRVEEDKSLSARARKGSGKVTTPEYRAIVTIQFLDALEPDLARLNRSDTLVELLRRYFIEARPWARQALFDRAIMELPSSERIRDRLKSVGSLIIGELPDLVPWPETGVLHPETVRVLFGLSADADRRRRALASEEARHQLAPGALGSVEEARVPFGMPGIIGQFHMNRIEHVRTAEFYRLLHQTVPHLAAGLEFIDVTEQWDELLRRYKVAQDRARLGNHT